MKNRRNIVELKYPPENPNDIWLKDGKFYRSTSEGWVAIGSEIKYTNKELMIADKPEGGTIGIDKETGEASIYNDVAKQWGPLGGGGGMTETTWQELKDKRDAGELTPGSLYRITDYQCTTTQENTQSAGHQFDIVLLALSEDKLAEEGWAMEHPTDVYDVTFADGITKKCYIYYKRYAEGVSMCNLVDAITLNGLVDVDLELLLINEANKTATSGDIDSTAINDLDGQAIENCPYNYFQNSNLSAWKVWYCLDNDKSRFAWADDRDYVVCNLEDGDKKYFRNPQEDYDGFYAWRSSDDVYLWTNTETPQVGSYTYDDTGLRMGPDRTNIKKVGTDGRGVIYRLIDEFNNDVAYDFKNIQFKRKLTDGQYDATNGTETWCYTLNIWYNSMCQDASIVGNTLPNSWNYISGVYDNVFGYATAMDLFIKGANTFAFVLGNNVVLSFLQFSSFYSGIYSNTIGNSFYSNTIGDNFNSNIIGNYFTNNTIGNGFVNNIIRNGFGNNTIGNDFYGNTIGNDFINKNISDNTQCKNYGNNGVELATKNDIGNIETALNNI